MVTKSFIAVNDALTLSGSDERRSSIAFQITGTFVGTLVVEGSNDAGATFVTMLMIPWGSATGVTSATAPGGWTVNTDGVGLVRLRCSAYTSGTAVGYAQPVIS